MALGNGLRSTPGWGLGVPGRPSRHWSQGLEARGVEPRDREAVGGGLALSGSPWSLEAGSYPQVAKGLPQLSTRVLPSITVRRGGRG